MNSKQWPWISLRIAIDRFGEFLQRFLDRLAKRIFEHFVTTLNEAIPLSLDFWWP
ncbi:hypothetical protein PINS_up000367 [Pythium insidiosum]|nr:hypothetical protein PINS_up000367 [Pythium insidiosum]